MEILEFDAREPLHFNLTGKFVAEDENWIHMTRDLTDYEFVMVTDGELYIAENKLESVVHTGEFRLMRPTIFQHGTRTSKCSFYWMHFYYLNGNELPVTYETALLPEGRLPGLSPKEKKLRLPIAGVVPKPERLSVLFRQLADCSTNYHSGILNDSYVSIILAELSAQIFREEREWSGKGSQLFNDIVGYIDLNIKKDIRVKEIAEYFGYNSKYITTLFHRNAGMSMKQYILNRKIEIAKSLLIETNRSISDIGYELGFSDNHNFSNTFKRIAGQTPGGYRDSYARRILLHE